LITDIVIGLQHGDEGKGKVTHHLLKNGEYTHCIRFNGGQNAGHTIYHNGDKIITHAIPAGVFFNVKSIIGSGCVLNIDKLYNEIDKLTSAGVDVRSNLKIAANAHIITEEHLNEDAKDNSIGTTKSGNGPAYRDKYARRGVRAGDIGDLRPFLIDMVEELYYGNEKTAVLMEGAQGFWLDPDWGDYPFVTSSHCGVAAAIQNGINPRSLRNVWGIAKIYETYVGKRSFQPEGEVFENIQRVGKEYGATTGRVRQCNWLNMKQLLHAFVMNGVNKLIFNKMDVLQEVGEWGIIQPDQIFNSEEQMREYLESVFSPHAEIFFSFSPEFV
jgi:adenylosuccinate synthase|tara:strand:- start:3420 stop:4403 length:984 start_codon:yes stop_codon:yes gene_type:complete